MPSQDARPFHELNFREKFERWHQATFGYVSTGAGTALDYHYRDRLIEARWEGFQAHARIFYPDLELRQPSEAQHG